MKDIGNGVVILLERDFLPTPSEEFEIQSALCVIEDTATGISICGKTTNRDPSFPIYLFDLLHEICLVCLCLSIDRRFSIGEKRLEARIKRMNLKGKSQ
jgi:hypothetical protein